MVTHGQLAPASSSRPDLVQRHPASQGADQRGGEVAVVQRRGVVGPQRQACAGFGRIVALRHRPPISHRIHQGASPSAVKSLSDNPNSNATTYVNKRV